MAARPATTLNTGERARELVGMEESGGAGLKPVPDEDDLSVIMGQPVEEASLQENLGEFPDRLSDQGEHPPNPEPYRESRLAPVTLE